MKFSSPSRAALRITLAYLIFAGLWIVASDAVLAFFVRDVETIASLGMLKGLTFVAVTALLLYLLLVRRFTGLANAFAERDAALADLQQGLARFEAVFEQAAVGIALVAPDGRWLKVNRRLAEIVGYTPEELLEKTFQDITHPDDLAADLAYVRQMLAREIERYAMEKRYIRKDGSTVWILLTVALVWQANGKPDYFISVVEDITRQHEAETRLKEALAWQKRARLATLNQMEDALAARREAEAANAELRELNATLEARVAERTEALKALNQSLESFVYSVSHDLKTPLRGIDGYCRLLEEDYAERLDDEGRLFLANVRNGVTRMQALIDDLLAYSRMERKPLTTTAVDPRGIIENLLAERGQEIEARNVQVRIALPPLTLAADADGLAIVLRNLLDNALKFTRHTPRAEIVIEGGARDGGVHLMVRDNGIGFEMKYHDRIFEIFQRLHRLEDYPGTGVGLALVKKAVERMGGRVWAESAPGAGATFHLWLPAAVG
ncbi:sensor histidine kinase [Sulfuricystis multivorans]|uniref:sensor histidine kinase n=1 Tax=Sulfuricystis multivorans TaxID=2211108 RepID=UPI000F8218D5|nr:PAS domain S-box protein [Sulfuricystis multivorans]